MGDLTTVPLQDGQHVLVCKCGQCALMFDDADIDGPPVERWRVVNVASFAVSHARHGRLRTGRVQGQKVVFTTWQPREWDS
jgi:hypothetical protein